GTLSQIATLHPPTAAVSMDGQKITDIANGTAASDAAAFGQIPITPNVIVVPAATGVAATDTAAINTGIADATSALTRCMLTGGNYAVDASLSTIDPSKMSFEGPGSALCSINPTSLVTGVVLHVTEAAFVSMVQTARIGGFTINGTNAGTGATGLEYGDCIGGWLDDLVVENFTTTGAIGIHMNNVTNWTERVLWTRVWVSNNTTGVMFDVNGGSVSFQYHRILDLRVNTGASQTGVLLKAGAGLGGSVIAILGNFGGTGCTFLHLSGNSQTPHCLMEIVAEMDAAGATGLLVDSGSSLSGNGVIDFSSGSPANTNNGAIQFGGWFNVNDIHLATEGVSALGGLALIPGPNDPTGVGIKADTSNNMFLFAPSSGGLIVLRPNGPESGTGQWFVDTTGKMNTTGPTATTATAGTNGAVPSQVVGYLETVVGGTTVKIPYFAT
ncbi:MAG: hypothetical protein ACRETA_12185, partial [Gammaproteobacteria bacterium]